MFVSFLIIRFPPHTPQPSIHFLGRRRGDYLVWTGDRSRGVAAVFLFFAVKSIDANLQDPLGFPSPPWHMPTWCSRDFCNTHVCSYPSVGSMIAIEPAVNWQPVLINVSMAGDHRMWSAVTQHASQNESFIRSIAFDGKYIFYGIMLHLAPTASSKS